MRRRSADRESGTLKWACSRTRAAFRDANSIAPHLRYNAAGTFLHYSVAASAFYDPPYLAGVGHDLCVRTSQPGLMSRKTGPVTPRCSPSQLGKPCPR